MHSLSKFNAASPQLKVTATGSNQNIPKNQLICFSHLRWNFVFQRPQHLLVRAAKFYEVIFFEEPIFGRYEKAHLDMSYSSDGVLVVVPMLPSGINSKEQTVMLRSLASMLLSNRPSKSRIAWYYTPMALEFTDGFDFEAVVYDCMDELSAFKNSPNNISILEMGLMSKADVVFTGGYSLYEAKVNQHHNIHAFPSSIDTSHFGKARSVGLAEPEDLKPIPYPRVGFFGVIDERTDLELLWRLVSQRPDLQFVMVGPVVKIDPDSLPRMSNIHWLGQKDYKALPNYLGHWDAGFMPFALNESTRFISPTKTPEYLAAGIPVVSTPIRDVVRHWGSSGVVEIAHSAEDMSCKIDQVLQQNKSQWLEKVDVLLAPMSWDLTFKLMNKLIRQNLRVKRPNPYGSGSIKGNHVEEDLHV